MARSKNTTESVREALAPRNQAFATFGEMPPELADALAGYNVTEAPGVAPDWKPQNPGDYIVGQIIDYKAGIGKYGGDVIALTGKTMPGDTVGIFSVWLAGDLAVKITKEWVDRVVVIYFERIVTQAENKRLQGDMRQYKVYEVTRRQGAA